MQSFSSIRRIAVMLVLLATLGLGLAGLIFPASTPPQDYVSAWENRISALRAKIPVAVEMVGYISDADLNPGKPAPDDYIEYYLTQYSLAPVLVQRGMKSSWVIINSKDPNLMVWLERRYGKYRLEKIGGGLYLLEIQ